MLGVFFSLLLLPSLVQTAPLTNPYVPFRTSPFDQAGKAKQIDLLPDTTPHALLFSSDSVSPDRCPLHFSLGISKRWHNLDVGDTLSSSSSSSTIHKPPVIRTVFPAGGPGKQVVYATQYEHLDLLSPAMYENTKGRTVQEVLVQALGYPLLWESSSFRTSPLVHDVNGDGIDDVIVSDYDGGISAMGLAQEPGKSRYFHHAQVPRLHLRRDWIRSRLIREVNASASEEDDSRDPYHSYFEYYYSDSEKEQVLRGITANVLDQDVSSVKSLQQRRSRAVSHENDVKREIREPDGKQHDESQQPQKHETGDIETLGTENKYSSVHEAGHEEQDAVGEPNSQVEGSTSVDRHKEFLDAMEEKPAENQEPAAGEPNSQVEGSTPVDRHKEFLDVMEEKPAENQEPAAGEPNSQVEGSTPVDRHKEFLDVMEEKPAENQEPAELSAEQLAREQPKGELEKITDEKANNHSLQQEQFSGEPRYVPKEKAKMEEQEPEQHAQEHHLILEEKQSGQWQQGDLSGKQQMLDEQKQPEHVGAAGNPNMEQEQRQEDSIKQMFHQDRPVEHEAATHRRLQEEEPRIDNEYKTDDGLLDPGYGDGKTGDDMFAGEGDIPKYPADDIYARDKNRGLGGDARPGNPDYTEDPGHDDMAAYEGDHKIDDDYRRYTEYDDIYGRDYRNEHDDFYDDKHYIRIPPHILSTPVWVEIPRLYGDREIDNVLLVAVSYFFDEDEYEGKFSYKRYSLDDHGDETAVKRGMYVATAIMGYNFVYSGRWSLQTHLDLSADFSTPENVTIVGSVPIRSDITEMGAFSLGSPTVADIDGDGTPDVLVGTSMGMLYAMDGRMLGKKEHWPVQLKHPIETRPVVEDVVGDTNLEVFVMDRGGNVVCFSHDATVLWNRDILASLDFAESLSGASPMTLGDIDGNGFLDLVVTVSAGSRYFIFAFEAATGKNVKNFPMELIQPKKEEKPKKEKKRNNLKLLAQPLLVDLHAEQDYILDYIRRDSREFRKGRDVVTRDSQTPQGGTASGLHIVQPVKRQLFIVEAGSGCTHKTVIGDQISSMVQVDDIHGTNRLDLLVTTQSGNVLTLETSTSFHPLNTWAGGDMRSKNSHAHGYSASQGIFVHENSRQYKDVFGVYVPITFEIFDNRPNIRQEPEKRIYKVEVRDGSSSKRVLHKAEYNETGVRTERVYVRYGPGYYTLCVVMHTSHGISYEDCFATGYNAHFMGGFGVMLWLPLVLASVIILLCGVQKNNWEDDDDDAREGRSSGILGRALPT